MLLAKPYKFASISTRNLSIDRQKITILNRQPMQQPNLPSPAGSKHQINQSIHLPTRLNFITQ
jgi:hypothetical protein